MVEYSFLHTTTHSRWNIQAMLFFPDFSFRLCRSGKTWRLEEVIAKLNEKYGTQLVVNFFVGSDDRDSNSHIIHVGVRL